MLEDDEKTETSVPIMDELVMDQQVMFYAN